MDLAGTVFDRRPVAPAHAGRPGSPRPIAPCAIARSSGSHGCSAPCGCHGGAATGGPGWPGPCPAPTVRRWVHLRRGLAEYWSEFGGALVVVCQACCEPWRSVSCLVRCAGEFRSRSSGSPAPSIAVCYSMCSSYPVAGRLTTPSGRGTLPLYKAFSGIVDGYYSALSSLANCTLSFNWMRRSYSRVRRRGPGVSWRLRGSLRHGGGAIRGYTIVVFGSHPELTGALADLVAEAGLTWLGQPARVRTSSMWSVTSGRTSSSSTWKRPM